jgi:hypothetical protein
MLLLFFPLLGAGGILAISLSRMPNIKDDRLADGREFF